jgi:multiple sugar transport system permease protein
MVAPAIVFILAVFILPMAVSLQQSLTNLNMTTGESAAKFIGLKNYVKALRDPETLNSIWVTVSYTAVTVSAELVLGTVVALVLDEVIGFQRLVRTTIILPMMTSSIVVGLIWRLLWNADYGVINAILQEVGLPRPFWLGPGLAFSSVCLTEIWQNTPFVVLLVLAGLSSLPEEPFEAAAVEGASYLQSLFYITLPLLAPVFLVILLFRTMFALRAIEAIWILTSGGPANETMVYGLHIYREAFAYFNTGYASALSWILLVMMAIFTFLYNRALQLGT